MAMRHALVLAFAALAVLFCSVSIGQCFAQRTTRANVYRRAAARGGGDSSNSLFEVAFSNAEEDLLKAKQRDAAEVIAGFLPGKSPHQVARRCVELGLKCGDAVAPPERNSEQWRNIPRRQ